MDRSSTSLSHSLSSSRGPGVSPIKLKEADLIPDVKVKDPAPEEIVTRQIEAELNKAETKVWNPSSLNVIQEVENDDQTRSWINKES